VTILTSKSFLFALFGIPLISTVIFGAASAIGQNSQASEMVSALFQASDKLSTEGYIDQSGLIQNIPADIPPSALEAYGDEATAQQALAAGEISAYYLIPSDYVETGRLYYIRPDFNPLSAQGQSYIMRRVLKVNLLDGDTRLVDRLANPMRLEVKALSPEPQREQDNPLTFFLPYAVTIIYYIIILGAASLLLTSVTKEKENRVVEILMASVTPRQLLAGKIVGLGAVGLMQTVLWVGTGYGLLRLSGRTFSLPASFQLPPSFLVWGLIFFLLGYAIYASLMAGMGALVPNLREAGQATFVVILPLIIPMMLISILIEEPNGALATTLSLIPLTAPVAMMTRLAAGSVPWWQPAVSSVLMALTAFLIVRAVAGMFRAQTLLSGQAFHLGRFFKALAGKG
jgi:ABC-2 type transport system permease protein